MIRDTNGHYIVIKGSIYQEDITRITTYVPNEQAPKYINYWYFWKKDIKENMYVVGNFNTPFSIKDRSELKRKDTAA